MLQTENAFKIEIYEMSNIFKIEVLIEILEKRFCMIKTSEKYVCICNNNRIQVKAEFFF